jgi:hypothetical protein
VKPFTRASIPESEIQIVLEDVFRKWVTGDALMRKQFPAADARAARGAISAYLREEAKVPVYKNDRYQVQVRAVGDDWVSLSIKRNDRQPIHDWRDLQEIKNKLIGPECEGFELYPSESRKVDTANQYFLFVCTDETFRVPVGFNERMVSERPLGKSVNRPFA